MKTTLHIFFLCFAVSLFAQNTQQEIDDQIWVPFTGSWESNDSQAFNAIHSDDVRRITGGKLLVGEEYKNRNKERMQGQANNKSIEFAFETRSSNGKYAYEVGYFRIVDKSEGTPQYYVGRFHVALRKIDGAWKITQDWDTGDINGVKITAESVSNLQFIHF